MVTSVDTSILIDVLIKDPVHGEASKAALQRAASEGSLIICETVLAETSPALTPAEVPLFIQDWGLSFVPSSEQSALLAGRMFKSHLERGGKQGRVAADFLIAAHAQIHADRLLARDRGYYRDYFKHLKLWDPAKG
ncbi:MAG: type II toxin-antitoxin system VapC family toxin [Verrucomicrobiae bacterium]|nr:type II toxin-antitoxin system VapC family toxin [Verrucomicrobiae bacterium]